MFNDSRWQLPAKINRFYHKTKNQSTWNSLSQLNCFTLLHCGSLAPHLHVSLTSQFRLQKWVPAVDQTLPDSVFHRVVYLVPNRRTLNSFAISRNVYIWHVSIRLLVKTSAVENWLKLNDICICIILIISIILRIITFFSTDGGKLTIMPSPK